jgi:RNA polymerase sigma factor (sigma-70 family)
MMMSQATVFIVDDDSDMRRSLAWLIESIGQSVRTFESAESFLEAGVENDPGCLLLDVRMGGIGGIRLLEILKSRGCRLPVIMFTGHGDIAMAVQTMKSGAFDFLEKPASHQAILDRVNAALALDWQNRQRNPDQDGLGQLLAQLTRREREILDFLVDGLSTRLIAERLAISERTVDKHRQRLIEKLQARSAIQMVRRVLDHRRSA